MTDSRSPGMDADRLDAFLGAHAVGQALPVELSARGEALFARLAGDPPRVPQWGRFLVALGELAAEGLGDPGVAAGHFRRAIADAPRHGDGEAAVTAGYDLGVLLRRSGDRAGARAAWLAAARSGFQQGVVCAAGLRAAEAVLSEALDAGAEPGDDLRALAKQAWLGWLWLGLESPQAIDQGLADALRALLVALLLGEDPLTLAGRWRAWRPALIPVPGGVWRDGDPRCLTALFTVAGESVRRAGGGLAGSAEAYALLAQASRRQGG